MFLLDRLTGLLFTAILLVAGSFGLEAAELRNPESAQTHNVVNVEVPTTTLAPTTTIAPTTSVVITTTTSTSTTTTTTIPGIDDADCPQMWSVAVEVGWPVDWLPKLDRIVMAESGCTHDVVSRTKDYGYTQINWSAHHHRLEEKGITREDLLDPRINLTEALWIAEYARDNYGCWSQPWYMSGDWC